MAYLDPKLVLSPKGKVANIEVIIDKGKDSYALSILDWEGKRLITYNGVFKESVMEFKKGNLDGYIETDMTEYIYRILYQWGQGDYVEKEKRELTQDEKERFNYMQIEELDVGE